MGIYTPGSIVRAREREWVVLPTQDPNLILLRPLVGDESELSAVYVPFVQRGLERVEPAQFPMPKPNKVGDMVGAKLLWNASRLSLREGAGPFRSLGRISVRPRPYQFVPLLMALRLDPVRLFIADDVGVGKTIEALVIARELLVRGEARRIAILCPPYLCDQWQYELAEKFHIEAVVVRSGTISQLERLAGNKSIFEYFPYLVVSIDYAKMDTHRSNFLQYCPDLVIVDEVHGCARPSTQDKVRQQRYELLREVAKDPNRHLILLSATPHSGVEESFRSLLGLLNPQFEQYDLQNLDESARITLARHFIQRRRDDVKHWVGETPFPERQSDEVTYDLTPAYQALFQGVFEFTRELVQDVTNLTKWQRRVRYWSALAILRCVMSSPASAQAVLERKAQKSAPLPDEELVDPDSLFAPYVVDPTDEQTEDSQPTHLMEQAEATLSQTERDRRRLNQFAKEASRLFGVEQDAKLKQCLQLTRQLLRNGFQPIIWCRYIPTSDYVAEQLRRHLEPEFPKLGIASVTGKDPEEKRKAQVEELAKYEKRILVATDCLSEGINLQNYFNAVIHYDLPWNPNRLEQREGRVDRFGQTAPIIKTFLLYGMNNPLDGVVLEVLLRKAREIRNALGISVPVPDSSESLAEVILQALLFRAQQTSQLALELELDDPSPTLQAFQKRWEAEANRERTNRTRFAQRSIKPDEVTEQLKATDSVLGDPNAVRQFVLDAFQRLGIPIHKREPDCWRFEGRKNLNLSHIPEMVRLQLPEEPTDFVFDAPTPPNTVLLGRNHPLVATLAHYLLESALEQGADSPAPRLSAIRTDAVDRRTVLLLLRLRYLLYEPDRPVQLAEEVRVFAYQRGSGQDEYRVFPAPDSPFPTLDSLLPLLTAKPTANLSPQERIEWVQDALSEWNTIQPLLTQVIQARAQELTETHKRLRETVHLKRGGLKIEPQLPPDLISLLVLVPQTHSPFAIRHSQGARL